MTKRFAIPPLSSDLQYAPASYHSSLLNVATAPVDYGPSRMSEVTVSFAYDRYVFGKMDSYSRSLREAVEQARTQLIAKEFQKRIEEKNE